jgi:transcriptional regulator with XRE-family HTH domain
MTRRVNGAALKAIREALGIRQNALAYRVGISKFQLSKIEHGVNGASPEVTRRLADELGVSLDAITHPVQPVPA